MGYKLIELCQQLKANIHVEPDINKEADRASVGDLLSYVIGSDSDETVWVTIQTHLNVAAVAVLKEIPLIVIASGRIPADDLIERCRQENIGLVTVDGSIFDTCLKLGEIGLVG